MLYVVASNHFMQFQGKLKNQTLENGKKTSFRHNFGPFGPGSPAFFFKYLALSVTRYHGQVSSCTILEKTNNPISRKLSERQKDRQRDRLMDKSDFIGQTLSNVERPKTKKLIINFFFM